MENRQRTTLPNWTGDVPGLVTALVLAFNIWFFCAPRYGSNRWSALWDVAGTPKHLSSDLVIVGTTILTSLSVWTVTVALGVSALLLVYWLAARGNMSTRLRLVWVITLSGVIFGWPIACACVGVVGIGQTGMMVH